VEALATSNPLVGSSVWELQEQYSGHDGFIRRITTQSQTSSNAHYSHERASVGVKEHGGVSRIYEISFSEGLWRLWRNNTGFSQRFEGRVSPDRKTIGSHWEKSFDGAIWEHDFDITYTRL
jgi:hypothetical protein